MIMPRKQVKLKQPSNTDTLFKLPVPIPEPPRMVNIKPSVPDLSINCEDEKEEAAHLRLNFDYQQHTQSVNGLGSNVNRDKPNDKDIDILKEIARIDQRIRLNGLKDSLMGKDTSKQAPTPRRNGKETSPKDKSASRLAVSPSSSGKSSPRDVVNDVTVLRANIRQMNEKLDRIAEQVQLILSLNLKKEPEKRSIGTMTNIPVKTRSDKSVVTPRRSSERSKKKISDSGLLTSESESRSDGSELRSRSKVREEYYEKILRNVDQRLSNSRSEQSESISSNSPPRGNRSLPTSSRASDEIELITKLAEKYLKGDKADNKSRRGLTKKTSLSEGEEQKLRRCKRSSSRHPPKTVSDFTEEASIGVTNYFEKYGLYDD